MKNKIKKLIVEKTPTEAGIVDKINELVDVVNGLYHVCSGATTVAKNEPEHFVQDFYSEDWIGTLCRFWDENNGDKKHHNCHYGILESINRDVNCELRFTPADMVNPFRYCEPIDEEELELYKGNHHPRAWVGCVPTTDCCTYNPDNNASTPGGLF